MHTKRFFDNLHQVWSKYAMYSFKFMDANFLGFSLHVHGYINSCIPTMHKTEIKQIMSGMISVVHEPNIYLQHRSQYIYMGANINRFTKFRSYTESKRKSA